MRMNLSTLAFDLEVIAFFIIMVFLLLYKKRTNKEKQKSTSTAIPMAYDEVASAKSQHAEKLRATIEEAEEKTRVKTRMNELAGRRTDPSEILRDLLITFEDKLAEDEIIEVVASSWSAPVLAFALSSRGYDIDDIAHILALQYKPAAFEWCNALLPIFDMAKVPETPEEKIINLIDAIECGEGAYWNYRKTKNTNPGDLIQTLVAHGFYSEVLIPVFRKKTDMTFGSILDACDAASPSKSEGKAPEVDEETTRIIIQKLGECAKNCDVDFSDEEERDALGDRFSLAETILFFYAAGMRTDKIVDCITSDWNDDRDEVIKAFIAAGCDLTEILNAFYNSVSDLTYGTLALDALAADAPQDDVIKFLLDEDMNLYDLEKDLNDCGYTIEGRIKLLYAVILERENREKIKNEGLEANPTDRPTPDS